MKATSVLSALGVVIAAALPVACSLLYADYDSRFASVDASALPKELGSFVTEDATVSTVAATTSALYYSVGARIVRVSLDGGGRAVVWSGEGTGAFPPPTVLALVSDGTTHLAWSYGALGASPLPTSVYVADLATDATPEIVGKGGKEFGYSMASDSKSVVWTLASVDVVARPGTSISVLETDGWLDGGPDALAVLPPAGPRSDAGKSYFASAVAMNPTSTYAYVANLGLVTWGRATASPGSTCAGIERTTGVGLAAAPSRLYVVLTGSGSGASGALTRYEIDGGCPAVDGGVVLDPNDDVMLFLAADQADVYWVTTDRMLHRASVDGSDDQMLGLAGRDGGASAMAIDDASVYVASGRVIYRFQKASERD